MRVKQQAGFYTHRTVAKLLDIDTETLRKWVRQGMFPLPLAVNGQTLFYKISWIDHYLKFGTWPDGVAFEPGVGRGRKGFGSPAGGPVSPP